MPRMLTTAVRLLALAAALLFAVPASASVTVKLATLAPEGTVWHKGLRKMADEWTRLSGGEVKVKIYAGGVAGNESVMVRKMRIGQLHGGALTNIGLLDIEPSAQVIQTPMLIRDYSELDYVMERMSPEFERRLDEKGFVVLSWGDVGWVHFFSKQPMRTPAEAGNFKVFAWEGDPAAVQVFRDAGFKPVVIASTDVIPSLQSGLIDAFPQAPLFALSAQWFALAPNMLDMQWAPLMGATLVTKDVWEKIPEKFHKPFKEAARQAGEGIKEDIRRQDKKAIEVMKQYGLKVVEIDAATHAAWLALAESIYPTVRTEMVPPEVFDATKAHVEAYRQLR